MYIWGLLGPKENRMICVFFGIACALEEVLCPLGFRYIEGAHSGTNLTRVVLRYGVFRPTLGANCPSKCSALIFGLVCSRPPRVLWPHFSFADTPHPKTFFLQYIYIRSLRFLLLYFKPYQNFPLFLLSLIFSFTLHFSLPLSLILVSLSLLASL